MRTASGRPTSAGSFPFRWSTLSRWNPGPGGLASTLTYNLGILTIGPGDVLLQDGVGGPVLDVVRFNAAPGAGAAALASLVFYSTVPRSRRPRRHALAACRVYQNNITIQELGTETNNGAFYTPSTGQPGLRHRFCCDLRPHQRRVRPAPAPEPSTLSLIGLGLLGLGAMRRRRRDS